MEFTDAFWKLRNGVAAYTASHSAPPRYISSCGGTRSGKTYSTLQLLRLIIKKEETPTITSVVSETLPHLKRGAIRDFQNIMGAAFDDSAWNKTDGVYTFPNGSVLEFFSADSPAKVHGPARHRLFINEAQNIAFDVFRHLSVRTSGTIILDYNPTHHFWVDEEIEPRPNCVRVHTTYKDNGFLTAEQVREIESNRGDANWWKVYGEGEVGSLDGLIFPDFDIIDTMPDPVGLVEVYGLDFGFTNDPTVLVRLLIDTKRKEIFVDELVYRRGMLNSDIIATLAGNSVRGVVFADCAEPKTIAELHRAGYNVKPCYKATRKAEQLQALRGYRHHVTRRSKDTIYEYKGYVWQKDKDDHQLNEPTPLNDHAMDAIRYAAFTTLGASASGRYTISF